MSWRDWFVSRHTLFLEQEIEDLKKRHETDIINLKSAHDVELSRVITECERLRDEAQRIRLYLTPALQSVQLEPDKSGPPAPTEVPMGTPWQRILAREVAKQEKDWAARHVQTVETPAGEESNGGTN